MTFKVSTIEPQFVQVQYDIVDTYHRDQMRHKLLGNGFVMMTESVYYGLFTAKVMEDVQKLTDAQGVRLVITTPAFPSDQAEMLRQQYENRFIESFDEAEEKLLWIEQAISGEIQSIDKETKEEKPFTQKQILQRLRTAGLLVEELQTALARRQDREGFDDKMNKNFERLGARLRQMDSYVTRLLSACNKMGAKA